MLIFKPVTLDTIAQIEDFLPFQSYRTCDFSVGGIYMWAEYFSYEYAIFKDTLFLKGVSEVNSSEMAFSLPLGALSLEESVEILRDYCRESNRNLVLSAVPEEAKQELVSRYSCKNYKLENWTDYLYDAEMLATLPGSLYHKKRNHVSKFKRMYPEAVYQPIHQADFEKIRSFLELYCQQNHKLSPLFQNELNMTAVVLEHFPLFHFTGAVLMFAGEVIGFTVGEVINDTLYVHIEKADRSFDGVYETLSMKFAGDVLDRYPGVKYVNREEDVGDAGLRKAKWSYHPVALLGKYNLEFCD